MEDKSPKQIWRKIQFRLRPNQLDEANMLKDYDARSQLLGRPDHDYIRRLLLIGHLFVSKLEESGATSLALSSNDVSRPAAVPRQIEAEAVLESSSSEVVGSAIRSMAGIFGDKKLSS